jgi:hypothetical protein
MKLNVPDHKPVETEEDLSSRKFKTESAGSKLHRYNPLEHSVIDERDKHRQMSTVQEPAQKEMTELYATPSDNYNRLDDEALNSTRPQTNLSFHVVPEIMLLQLHRHTGKNNVKKLLPSSLQSPDFKLETKSFDYQSNVPRHSLQASETSPLQKQNQTYPPQLLREKPHRSRGYTKFDIQQDQKYSGPHTWPSLPDESDVLPKIARPIYLVPSHERTEYSQSLNTHPRQTVESKRASFYFTQGNQELELPQQRPENDKSFAQTKRAKHQQLGLEVQQETTYTEQNHITQKPHQASPEFQTTEKRILPENLQEAENKSKDTNRNGNLTTNIQDSFINQQSICPYKQHKAPLKHSLYETYSTYHSKNKEAFPAQFSTVRNNSENETPKEDLSINIQISLGDQHAVNPHKQEKAQSEYKVNQFGFLTHSVGIHILHDEPTSGQTVTQNDTKTKDIVINIQYVLEKEHTVYPTNQHKEQIEHTYNKANFLNLSNDAQMFHEKLTTGQNITENINRTKDAVTNIHFSLQDQESTYSYDQLEGQPEARFLHNSATTQFVPEKQTTGPNITQSGIKPNDILISIQNVSGNQHSLHPNNQQQEQITQEYNEARFLKLSNDTQILPETAAPGINVTGNISKTKDIVTMVQISLEDQQPKYPYDQRKGQPEYVLNEARKLHHPDANQMLPEKPTTGSNISQDDTKHGDVVSTFQNVLGNQHSIYPNNHREEQIESKYNEAHFLNQSNGTQILPEKGINGTYITQDDTKHKDVVSIFQNVLGNQHSIYPNNHGEEKIESMYNEAHFLNQSNGTQILPEKATTGTNITETINKDKEVFANITVSLENQQLIYPYDKHEEQKEHMLHEASSLYQSNSTNILPEKLQSGQNITENDINQNDVVTSTENSLGKEHKEQPENMPEERSFLYQPKGTHVFSAKNATGPNKTVNTIDIKNLPNNKNSTIYQTVNRTGNTTVNVEKLENEFGIENEKFLKNVMNTSVTVISFTSVPSSNSTNQSDVQVANRFAIEQSPSQNRTAPETTTLKSNRKNLKRQETTTRKPASLKSPTQRQATPKPAARTEVTQKPVLRNAATHISSTQKISPGTPKSPIPSKTKLSIQSQSTQINSTRSSRTYNSSTQTPSTQTLSTKAPSSQTPPTQTASTELPYTQTTSLETTYTQIPSTQSPFAQK